MTNHRNCPRVIYYKTAPFPSFGADGDMPEDHPEMVAYDAAAPACTCGKCDPVEITRGQRDTIISALRTALSNFSGADDSGIREALKILGAKP